MTGQIQTVRRDVAKIIEAVEPRVTKLTIPTAFRDDFRSFLSQRKVQLVSPAKTDVWNNVESAYTHFEISLGFEVTSEIFEEWKRQPDA